MFFWIAFAASMILFVILPTPQRRQVSVFALQRGRWTGLVTIPAMVFTAAITFTLAMAPLAAIAIYEPDLIDFVALVGLVPLIALILWSLRDHRSRPPIADNDNLPQRRLDRIFLHVARLGLGSPRFALALAGLLSQFIEPGMDVIPVEVMFTAYLALAAISGLVAVAFPRIAQRRKRRAATRPASGKSGTVFIARRAVTAGFRRIAA